VAVDYLPPRQLRAVYTLHGDVDAVRWPVPTLPRHTDKLWQHTCCELFVRDASEARYVEFNFSPSTAWAAYELEGYRSGSKPLRLAQAPQMRLQRGVSRCDLSVTLSPGDQIADLELCLIAAAVVTEDRNGQLSYWAINHPAEKPDFHHADSFIALMP
jgi:hypothetical protein